jgi:hypothetical protein
LIPDTRFSSRLQDQLLEKAAKNQQDAGKKKALEGTTLSNHNSFALLDNDMIVNLASEMGISIPLDQFDAIDVMKDLEIARHALDRVKKKEIVDPNECDEKIALQNDEIPMLEWLDEESEGEQFILLQSKKKKQVQIQLDHIVKNEPVRRSTRTAPSVYRNKGSGKS